MVLIERDPWSTVESGLATEPTAKAKATDQRALSCVGLSVSAQHFETVSLAATAKEAWDGFAQTYAAKSFTRQMQLRRQLQNL